MVRPPQASGNEDIYKLASYPGHTFLMGRRLPRILRPGSGKQDRLYRKRRSVQPDAAEDNPGSDIPDSVYSHGHSDVQGTGPAVEPFCRFLLPDHGRILCIFEVSLNFLIKNFEKIWKYRFFAYLCNPKTKPRSVRITVSTQDSQSCNRGSIPLPTTRSSQQTAFFKSSSE